MKLSYYLMFFFLLFQFSVEAQVSSNKKLSLHFIPTKNVPSPLEVILLTLNLQFPPLENEIIIMNDYLNQFERFNNENGNILETHIIKGIFNPSFNYSLENNFLDKKTFKILEDKFIKIKKELNPFAIWIIEKLQEDLWYFSENIQNTKKKNLDNLRNKKITSINLLTKWVFFIILNSEEVINEFTTKLAKKSWQNALNMAFIFNRYGLAQSTLMETKDKNKINNLNSSIYFKMKNTLSKVEVKNNSEFENEAKSLNQNKDLTEKQKAEILLKSIP
jgi:hypothetical protein